MVTIFSVFVAERHEVTIDGVVATITSPPFASHLATAQE
jgi:hypothetical protein